MKTQIKDKTNCIVTLRIEVSKEELSQDTEEVYQEVGKGARISGFRPGKVPRKILEKHYGSYVKGEVIKRAIASSYRKALEDEKIRPVEEPDIKDIDFEDDSPLTYTATVEVEPEVNLAPYLGMKLTKRPLKVEEEEIEKALQFLRERHAKFIPDEEHPIETGDLVSGEMQGCYQGIPLQGTYHENISFIVGERPFLDFTEAFLGKKKGEEAEAKLLLPPDFHQQALAGKEATYKIKIKEVRRKILPSIDDDFAREVGEFEDLEKLKVKIRVDLEETKKRSQEEALKQEALERLIQESRMELPPTPLEKLRAYISEQDKRWLASQQELPEQERKEKEEELERSAYTRAVKNLKANYIIQEIALKEQIEVSDQEVQQKIEATYGNAIERKPRLKSLLHDPLIRHRYKDSIVEDKVLAFILDKAQIVEV